MASDRQCFKAAYERRVDLLRNRYLSRPDSEGTSVVLCSYYCDYGDDTKSQLHNRKDIKTYRKEAFSIAKVLGRMGVRTDVILNATRDDFDSILTDPTISSIYTIGHGCLSSLPVVDDKDIIYDWWDVANAADHLKTGIFMQRQCGTLHRSLNAPLGMFAVADLRQVIAPIGIAFEPMGLYHPANEFLVPAFDSNTTSYDEVKARFCYGGEK